MVSAALVLLILTTGALYQFIGLRRADRTHAPRGTMVSVDRQRLHAVSAGTGTPAVLFEAGIAASSLSWARVIPDIATFTRAWAYDRAGLGWSDPARTPRTVAAMLRELGGVIAHAKTGTGGPCVLVGHSFGAFLVYDYASAHPADVAGLVLLDPPSEWHHATRRQARMLWAGIQLSRLGGLLARIGVVRAGLALLTDGAPGVPRRFVRIFGSMTAQTLERLVGEVRKLPPEVHPIVQAHWSQPKCFRAMAEHLAPCKTWRPPSPASHRFPTSRLWSSRAANNRRRRSPGIVRSRASHRPAGTSSPRGAGTGFSWTIRNSS